MADVTAKLAAWIEEAVEYVNSETRSPSLEREGRALLAAYEQAQAEPVGEIQTYSGEGSGVCVAPFNRVVWKDGVQPPPGTKLFAAPVAQAEPRKPLTDEQIDAMWRKPMSYDWEHREFARAIEAAHNIKEQP